MPLVVDVEAVVSGMVLEIGHESGNVEQGHRTRVPARDPGSEPGTGHQYPCPWTTPCSWTCWTTPPGPWPPRSTPTRRRTSCRRRPGDRPGQYRIDLVADDAALSVLRAAGVGILSEESGLEDRGQRPGGRGGPRRRLHQRAAASPWYATSLCAVDADGPRAALVVNLATGTRYQAVRGAGATRDGRAIAVGRPQSGPGAAGAQRVQPDVPALAPVPRPGRHRSDLCSVADGRVDGTIDCTDSTLGPWDYLGAMLVLSEVGAHIADAQGRELVARPRRTTHSGLCGHRGAVRRGSSPHVAPSPPGEVRRAGACSGAGSVERARQKGTADPWRRASRGGPVLERIHLVALRIFGALPRRARRLLVRLGSPLKYTVGAICIIQRDDGAILLVRQSYGTW